MYNKLNDHLCRDYYSCVWTREVTYCKISRLDAAGLMQEVHFYSGKYKKSIGHSEISKNSIVS